MPRPTRSAVCPCPSVAGYGVAALYLDQVAAGRPAICFDPAHSHAPGCGKGWLEQGYWPMLQRIRQELRAAYPELALCSEDAAEPYMHLFDSYLPWRFVDVGQVPAYQAVYAGRIQMTGRVNTGDPQAKFAVAAEQALHGEQIGWFGVATLNESPLLRLFVKKLVHARQAFLPFFNSGDMLKPARWAGEMPAVTADWGYHGPRIHSTSALHHSAWRLGDAIALLFANTSYMEVAGELAVPAGAWGLPSMVRVTEVREGAAPTTESWRTSVPRRISVPGYSVAAWIIDPLARHPAHIEIAQHAERLAARFALMGEFEAEDGITPEVKRELGAAMDPWLHPDLPARPAAAPGSPPGQNRLIARAALGNTGGIESFATVRAPLLERPIGEWNVTVFLSMNWDSGPFALRRWKLATGSR